MSISAVLVDRKICGGLVGVRLHYVSMLSLFIAFVNRQGVSVR